MKQLSRSSLANQRGLRSVNKAIAHRTNKMAGLKTGHLFYELAIL